MNTFKKIISSVLMVVLLSGVFGTISVSASVYIPYDLYLDKNGVVYFKDGDISTKVADQVAKLDGKYIVTKKGKLFYCHQQQDWSWTLEYVMDDVKKLSDSVGDMEGFLVQKKNGEAWLVTRSSGRPDLPNTFKKKKIASNVKSIYTVYEYHANNYFVLKKDNSLWGFGANAHGELGIGTTNKVRKPKKILTDVKSFNYMDHFGMATAGHTCYAVKNDGSLYGWGYSDEDEIPEGYLIAGGDIVKTPLFIMDDVESVDGDSCFTIIIKKDHSLWGWGKYCDHWEGTTAYPDYMDLTLIASDVKYGGTNLYKGTNIVYYIDSNNTLWSHYANDLSASPKKCMKNVKSMDFDKQLVTTLNGKLYFCSSNYQSRHRVEKVLICR